MRSSPRFRGSSAFATAVALIFPLAPVARHAQAASPGQNGHIAYIRNDTPYDGTTGKPCAGDHVWVMNADGSGQTDLTPQTNGWSMGDPAWSPDGTRIAWTFNSPVNPGTLFVTVYNFQTRVHERSVPIPLEYFDYGADDFCQSPYGPTWSPDGTKLAIQSYRGLAVIDIAADYSLTHLDPPSTYEYFDVDWSPFGSRLAITYRNKIQTISTAGGDLKEVTWTRVNGHAPDRSLGDGDLSSGLAEPDWSPQGTHVVFRTATMGTNNERIAMGEVCSGDVVAVDPIPNRGGADYVDTRHYSGPSWSPDGARIAFSARFGSDPNRVLPPLQDIWAMNTDGTGLRNLTNTPRTDNADPYETAPDWQPLDPPEDLPDPPLCFREGGLAISQVTVDPDPPSPGQAFALKVRLRNDTGDTITDASPTVALAPDSVATLTEGPTPASADLEPGESATFTFAAQAIGDGEAIATVNASGTSPGGPLSAKERIRRFDVGSQLLLPLTLKPKYVGVGGTAKALLKVVNKTGHAVTSLVADLEVAPKDGVVLHGPSGGATSLATGAATTFQYRITARKKGELELTATARARVPFNGSTARGGPVRASLQVGVPTVEVTTTGDEDLPNEAKTARVCDVDADAPGRQCTLRAAIQLANAWKEVDKVNIHFDIPGDSIPAIRPEISEEDGYFAFPEVTKTVTIDGSTQSGGWVELTKSGGPTASGLVVGLALDGRDSVVRGLVVSGFAWGIVVTGDGTVVAGNRLGTDSSGLSPAPNLHGIWVAAKDVQIGGTRGTSANACTGDCNLVGASLKGQISAGIHPNSFDPNAIYDDDRPLWIGQAPNNWPVSGLRIQGNWVGLDAYGETAFSYPSVTFGERWGIAVTTEEHLSGAGRPRIGGASARPGVAPGNLVADLSRGIQAFSSTVQGNSVGLDGTGTQLPLYAGSPMNGFVGIAARDSVVGGTEPGAGNAVAGQQDGISVHASEGRQSDVIGNLVGTDVTGMKAFEGQEFGVYQSGPGKIVLNDNVISGNHVGVSGNTKIEVGHGNLIGLSRDGKTALPNNVGVGLTDADPVGNPYLHHPYSVVIGPRSGSCPETPCNVISGNRTAGIQLEDVAELSIRGAYIGTDVTGTVPVSNLTGVDVRGYSGSGRTSWQIGGPSRVLRTGRCDWPCNLIAGNIGSGMRLETVGSSGSEISPNIAGNLVGLAADGGLLPNGGDAIEVSGSGSAFPLVIGGDAPNGNVFFADQDSVVRVVSINGSTPRVAVRSNRFRMTPWSEVAAFLVSAAEPAPPLLESVVVQGDTLRVLGTTNATSTSAEIVEVYAVETCQSDLPLDAAPLVAVAANRLGGDFAAEVPVSKLGGREYVAALRTDADGRTSSFTECTRRP